MVRHANGYAATVGGRHREPVSQSARTTKRSQLSMGAGSMPPVITRVALTFQQRGFTTGAHHRRRRAGEVELRRQLPQTRRASAQERAHRAMRRLTHLAILFHQQRHAGVFSYANQTAGRNNWDKNGGTLPENSTPPSAWVNAPFLPPSYATIHGATNGSFQTKSFRRRLLATAN